MTMTMQVDDDVGRRRGPVTLVLVWTVAWSVVATLRDCRSRGRSPDGRLRDVSSASRNEVQSTLYAPLLPRSWSTVYDAFNIALCTCLLQCQWALDPSGNPETLQILKYSDHLQPEHLSTFILS